MKANELRIGNKFECMGMIQTVFELCDNTDRGRIKQAGYEYIIRCEENRNQYKPIEIKPILLTKDWLLKLGFEKKFPDETCNLFDMKLFKEKTVNGLNRGQGFMCLADFIEKEGWYLYLQTRVTLKYVHQLQNLYYTLTGEELFLSGI
jgi:hypothetical protein